MHENNHRINLMLDGV